MELRLGREREDERAWAGERGGDGESLVRGPEADAEQHELREMSKEVSEVRVRVGVGVGVRVGVRVRVEVRVRVGVRGYYSLLVVLTLARRESTGSSISSWPR